MLNTTNANNCTFIKKSRLRRDFFMAQRLNYWYNTKNDLSLKS